MTDDMLARARELVLGAYREHRKGITIPEVEASIVGGSEDHALVMTLAKLALRTTAESDAAKDEALREAHKLLGKIPAPHSAKLWSDMIVLRRKIAALAKIEQHKGE